MRNRRPHHCLAVLLAIAPLSACLVAGETQEQEAVTSHMPYDGAGRYTMATDRDGLRVQKLSTVAKRFGHKPYDKLWQGDHWQTERLVFTDVTTGARMVRLTNDYGSDITDYHKGSWSADGSSVVWRRKPGMWEPSTQTNGPTCVNSDGTRLRPVFRDAPGSRMVRKHQCDKKNPDVCYSMVGDKKLCAFSLKTGKYLRTLANPGGCWHLKSSIDGKWLLGYTKKDGKRFLWLVPTDAKDEADGNKRTKWISLSKPTHDSYYVHPTEPYVMFWYEGDYRTEGFRQKRFDNTDEHATGITFDWNHGDFGMGRCQHESGKAYYYDGTKWRVSKKSAYALEGEEYYDKPANYNGYTSYMPKDGDWVVGSRLVYPPYVSELQMHAVDPVENDRAPRFRICLIGAQRGACLDGVDGSPDGTKFLFNSNLWDANQVFYVVARNPEPPQRLALQGSTLTWQPANHAKETKGYLVYRAIQSGGPYTQITDLVSATTYTDPAPPTKAYYTVSAVEHSGLESPLSSEVACNWKAGPIRVFVEAEQSTHNAPIWRSFHGDASNLYYVWQRKKDAEGVMQLPVTMPAAGAYHVWARVKGTGTWHLKDTEIASAGADWQWIKGKAALTLSQGDNTLSCTTKDMGLALDAIWLATDAAFHPQARSPEDTQPPAPVKDLAAKTDGPFHVRLTWTAAPEKDVTHYNLYVSETAETPCTRATLIASPDGTAYLDWQLRPGKTCHYRITAVDRRGNESAPSAPASVKTEAARVVRLQQNLETGGTATLVVPEIELEPAPEVYRIWVRVEGGAKGYMKVVVNGKSTTWTMRASAKVAKTTWISYGQFGVTQLKTGANKIALEGKLAEFRVREIVVCNDLSWKPEGYTVTGCAW